MSKASENESTRVGEAQSPEARPSRKVYEAPRLMRRSPLSSAVLNSVCYDDMGEEIEC